MRESLMYGSVRGARGNSRPYRDMLFAAVHASGSARTRPTIHRGGYLLIGVKRTAMMRRGNACF